MAELEQQHLLTEAKAGSHRAFAHLMDQYIPPVFRFVYNIVHDSATAEDVTQDAFIKAWKSLRSFDTSKKFSTWIFQIAKNTAIDHLRKKKVPALSEVYHEKEDGEMLDAVSDPQPLPDEVFERAELLGEVRSALASLGSAYATVVQLHLEEELTFAEIAEVLGEPLDTVKSRYRRALLKVREVLAPKS